VQPLGGPTKVQFFGQRGNAAQMIKLNLIYLHTVSILTKRTAIFA